MIVADTNLVVYLVNGGPNFESAAAVYSKDRVWHVPRLWRSEYANVLATNLRVGSIDLQTSKESFKRAVNLLAGAEHDVDYNLVLELAAFSRRSAYDCEFVALAKTLGVPLVTNDGPLRKAFPEDTVSVKDFIQP